MDVMISPNDPYFDAKAVKAKMLAFVQGEVDKENLAAAQVYAGKASSYSAAAKWALDNNQPAPDRPIPPFALVVNVTKAENGDLQNFDVATGTTYVCPPVPEVKPASPLPAFNIDLGAHIYGNFYVCGPKDNCPADFVTPPINGHSYRKDVYPFGAWYEQVS